MFGYIMINPKQLSESDKQRYQAMYCGLCRVLDERHGGYGPEEEGIALVVFAG